MFQLQETISQFVDKGHRVLVFGRKHMKSWDVYKQSSTDCTGWFFTDNVLVLLVNISVEMRSSSYLRKEVMF